MSSMPILLRVSLAISLLYAAVICYSSAPFTHLSCWARTIYWVDSRDYSNTINASLAIYCCSSYSSAMIICSIWIGREHAYLVSAIPVHSDGCNLSTSKCRSRIYVSSNLTRKLRCIYSSCIVSRLFISLTNVRLWLSIFVCFNVCWINRIHLCFINGLTNC
jgi:hypothetical protein